jgi:hypothetical protein
MRVVTPVDTDVLKFVQHLGHSSLEEYTENTGLTMTSSSWGSSISRVQLYITFKDGFFASFTRYGVIDITNINNITAEDVQLHNKRMKYKNGQIAKLSMLKVRAIDEIKTFIADTFYVNRLDVKTEDITFINTSSFVVAGVSFSFEAVFTSDTFKIYTYSHMPYKVAFAQIALILAKYTGVEITKLRDADYDFK